VLGTLDVYCELCSKLVVSPARPHCVFNLHDVSRVFTSLSALTTPRARSAISAVHQSQTSGVAIARLWCHEVVRVFADRLVTAEGDVPLNCL